MARPRAVVLILVLLAAVVAAVAASEEESINNKPTILTPVADTPLGSFEGADGPISDDAMEDADAAPVGSPLGTTMTEPKPALAPPGATEADGKDSTNGGAAASIDISTVIAAAVATAGVFAAL
ncbi:hypothetical protein GUJ93_ZPchr0007g4384 [Zizania palustris]|uniref:Anther-specific protein BCP1 n=1 Tax=Zizania palustris TaxID=103762 RepID=A0A8J5T654_ZIZPA|nr:hypothetical protein GUJ93_ZPchr0007g4384 [Zizania palustris]